MCRLGTSLVVLWLWICLPGQGTGSVPGQGTRTPRALGQLSPHALESVLCKQRSLRASTRTQGSQKRTYRFVMKMQKASSSEACLLPRQPLWLSRQYGYSTITLAVTTDAAPLQPSPLPPAQFKLLYFLRWMVTLQPQTAQSSRLQSQPLYHEGINLPVSLRLSAPPFLSLVQLSLHVCVVKANDIYAPL